MKFELVISVSDACSMYCEYVIRDTVDNSIVAVYDEFDADNAYKYLNELNR